MSIATPFTLPWSRFGHGACARFYVTARSLTLFAGSGFPWPLASALPSGWLMVPAVEVEDLCRQRLRQV